MSKHEEPSQLNTGTVDDNIDELPTEESTMTRREAMKKVGKYSAYAAPVMLGMLSSKTTHAGCVSGCG